MSIYFRRTPQTHCVETRTLPYSNKARERVCNTTQCQCRRRFAQHILDSFGGHVMLILWALWSWSSCEPIPRPGWEGRIPSVDQVVVNMWGHYGSVECNYSLVLLGAVNRTPSHSPRCYRTGGSSVMWLCSKPNSNLLIEILPGCLSAVAAFCDWLLD